MVFAAGLYRIIRRAEGEDGWLAMASLASVVAGAGIFGAGTALFMVVAYRPATDPAVARAFWDAGWLAYNTAGFAFVAWIAIVAVATFRHRVLPRWTAWIGIPVALISLVGPFAVKAGTGRVLPAGLVRPGRRPHLRRMAARRLRGGLAVAPRSSPGAGPTSLGSGDAGAVGPAEGSRATRPSGGPETPSERWERRANRRTSARRSPTTTTPARARST